MRYCPDLGGSNHYQEEYCYYAHIGRMNLLHQTSSRLFCSCFCARSGWMEDPTQDLPLNWFHRDFQNPLTSLEQFGNLALHNWIDGINSYSPKSKLSFNCVCVLSYKVFETFFVKYFTKCTKMHFSDVEVTGDAH